MRASQRPGFLLAAVPLTVLALTAGCADQVPSPKLKTHPVTGTVRFKNGGPVSQGTIQFLPVGHEAETTTAEINKDGTYALSTLPASGKRLPGAVEGKYKVTVVIPLEGQNVHSVTLPQPVTVEPRENTIPVEIDKPRGTP